MGWKVGGLEGWRVGRLEGWKVGRLETCGVASEICAGVAPVEGDSQADRSKARHRKRVLNWRS
ncbi:MAG: hypothetical protein DPW09_43840 [Anaerolineae bacterium]|nr:hypothetical protein [Anaerolineae bacterium]